MTAKNLVIVESPAKAKTIEKYLGRNYKVVASLGHIRDLPKSQMGVDIEHNYEPKYISIRGKGDVIKDLKKNAKKKPSTFTSRLTRTAKGRPLRGTSATSWTSTPKPRTGWCSTKSPKMPSRMPSRPRAAST